MGNLCFKSTSLTKSEQKLPPTGPSSEDDFVVKTLSEQTGFTYRQVEQINDRFNQLIEERKRLDSRVDSLKPIDFEVIPGFRTNPLNKNISYVFFSFAKDPQNMTFDEFVTVLAIFKGYSNSTTKKFEEMKKEKLRFLFKIYDQGNNGFISVENLCDTIKEVLPEGFPDSHIVKVAQQMLDEMDRDNDRLISYEDFCETLKNVDIDSKINLPFLNRGI